MKSSSSTWNDRHIKTIMGNLLRAGVALSAIVILAGAFVYLSNQGRMPAH